MPPGGQPTGCLGGSTDLAERERVVRRRRILTARRTQAAQGLNVCRAVFAGRGTARARSTNATRSRPFRPETRVSGRLIDADDRHAQPVRGPADVEAHRHALAQAVDPWDGAQDLHERELEVVLAAARVAHQRAALAAVVHALDGAVVVPVVRSRRLGSAAALCRLVRHAGGAVAFASAAMAARRFSPTRSTKAGKLSPACRSRS